MKPRDSAIKAKRFEASEKARKVSSLEATVREFETMALDLSRQIAAEEERTGVKDPAHFAYSTFAKAAAQRRGNLMTSIADLKAKLDAARRDHEDAASELKKLEPAAEDRSDRLLRKADTRALAG
jgi:flagellar export protein FliJ